MVNFMVKEHTLILMEESLLGNSRMGNHMVKEHSLIEKLNLRDGNKLEHTRKGKC